MSGSHTAVALDEIGLIDLGESHLGDALKNAALECIKAQKVAAREALLRFKPHEHALEDVSPETLHSLLSQNIDVHGIATDRTLSNGICFNASHIRGSVIDSQVAAKRRVLDKLMTDKAQRLFETEKDLSVFSSGLFWYPPGCAMGWHTNSKAPGWRIYINFAERAGESFFRYQDPTTSELITLLDKHWNFRMFHVKQDEPFWHCVYSNTNRFSLGYIVKETSLKGAVLKKLKSLAGIST